MNDKKIKVMIATPAFSGKVNIQYALSFSNTYHMLLSSGIDVQPLVVPASSLLVSERNRILEAFWGSDCTHILCVDADLGWPPEAVLAMLQQDKEFIAGLYPARSKKTSAFTFRPVLNDNGSVASENHLLKMNFIPAGFLLLSRECIKKMRDFYPELYYCPKEGTDEETGGAAYCLFNTEVFEGEFWGEDYTFCRRARNAGIDIWVDPLIQFDHDGKIGMFIECLTDDPKKSPQQFQDELKSKMKNQSQNQIIIGNK